MTAVVSVTVRAEPQFYDLDPMNVVWHGNYPRFMELGRVALLDRIGYGYAEMVASGYAYPVTEMSFRYIQPIKPGAPFDVRADLVARLGLHGPSLCVGASRFSFETALQLAELDLRRGVSAEALVGTADSVIPPLDVHRRRLDRPENDPLGEASHWLWLTTAPGAGPVLGAVELFDHREALTGWADAQGLDGATLFAAGQHLADDEAEALRGELGLGRSLAYRSGRPYYDCQAGAAIGAFLSDPAGAALLHLNRDPDGRYAAILVRRRAP